MKEIEEKVKMKLEAAKKEKVTFLLVGQCGNGKSSTINSLMGKVIAPVNDFEPETMSIEKYDSEINGIKFQAIDTPGLCDDLEEKGNDSEYMKLISENIKSFDCLLFVARLDETRVKNDEKRAIKILSNALGKEIWKNAVIIFTFSGNIAPEKFNSTLIKRTELIKNEISNYTTNNILSKLNSVAVDNKNKILPNGEEWLGELYLQTFLKISSKGGFLLATANRVNIKKKPKKKYQSEEQNVEYIDAEEINDEDLLSSKINLNEEQTKQVKKVIDAELITGLALTGAAIGSAFGPVGTAVGGAIGAAAGLIAWLWD